MAIEKLAILDVGNTLVKGHYIWKFAQYLKDEGHFNPRFFDEMEKALGNYSRICPCAREDFHYMELASDSVNFFGNGIKGEKKDVIEEMGRECVRIHSDKKLPFTNKLTKYLNDKGFLTLAISLAPMDVISPFCEDVDIQGAIATTYKTGNGFYTGEVDETYAGYRKLDAVVNFLKEHGLSEDVMKNSAGFGDSINDDFLFLVRYPFALYPSCRLKTRAGVARWDILEGYADFDVTEKVKERLEKK
ncbi:MAG: hypothetical protein V3U72_01580 [Candidatus Aenigmarchaeota archaeon]